jgi:hypothetical protein
MSKFLRNRTGEPLNISRRRVTAPADGVFIPTLAE